MFSLICVWINNWVNNSEAGDLRRYRAHYDVIAMNAALVTNLVADPAVFIMDTVYVDALVPMLDKTGGH